MCPSPIVLKGALSLISKIMNCFQKEFRRLVLEAEDMELEVFCSLTNSNIKFIAGSRSTVDRIQKLGVLKEDEINNVTNLVLHRLWATTTS